MTSTKRPWGQLTDLILAVLAEHGRMTQHEIAEETGASIKNITQIMWRLTKPAARLGQRAHVVTWVQTQETQRVCLRPVYRAGAGPNAPRPELDEREQRARRWRARRERRRNASVFNLAAQTRELGL